MAAQPKRKISHFRKGKRMAQKHKTALKLVVCKHCGQKKRPHFVCSNCHKL